MWNFNDVELSMNLSMEYFINHWKYWKDYNDSTLLIDPSMRIVAFFDRWTRNIDVIQAWEDWNENKFYECLSNDIGNVKVVEHKFKALYEPLYYKYEIEEHREEIDKLETAIKKEADPLLKTTYENQIEFIKKSVSEKVKEYNKNYFVTLINQWT